MADTMFVFPNCPTCLLTVTRHTDFTRIIDPPYDLIRFLGTIRRSPHFHTPNSQNLPFHSKRLENHNHPLHIHLDVGVGSSIRLPRNDLLPDLQRCVPTQRGDLLLASDCLRDHLLCRYLWFELITADADDLGLCHLCGA